MYIYKHKPVDMEPEVSDVLGNFLLGVELFAAVRELFARVAAQGEGDHDAHYDLSHRTRAQHAGRQVNGVEAHTRTLPASPTNAAASLHV